jgi:CubicO group peptidase (beta-lactamase class C family)
VKALAAALAFGGFGASMACAQPLFPPHARVLFQGDSITDMGRGRTADPNHILGHSYVFLIAAEQAAAYPNQDVTFINRGVSGNTVPDLAARWQADALDQKPDVLSILIGINDVAHSFRKNLPFSIDTYREGYDQLLQTTRAALPNVKLMLCEPFLAPGKSTSSRYADWQAAVAAEDQVVAELAEKYHAPVVHLERMFTAAFERASYSHWIWDGVHPTYAGQELVAREWERTYREFYGADPVATTLQTFIDHKLVAGAVAVVVNRDRTLDQAVLGYSNLAAHTPMAADTLFWIASMSKPIAGTAMMMLVEQGRVGLNDPVAKYLPEFEGQRYMAESGPDQVVLKVPERPMAVHDLMSHISGLPPRAPMDLPAGDRLPLADLVRTYALAPLDHAPGTHYAYSSPGINTAGRIVEVVGGMPYEEFLRQHIFEPLGMTDTTFFPSAAQVARLAKSYRTGWVEGSIDSLTYPLDGPGRHPMPAGGLFSTAGDMAKFCQMILRGGTVGNTRLLSEASIHAMTTKETPDAIKTPYGYGWTVSLGLNGEGFGHSGAYCTYMFVDPKADLAAVLMVQHQRGWSGPEEKTVWQSFARAAYEAAAPELVTPGAEILAH